MLVPLLHKERIGEVRKFLSKERLGEVRANENLLRNAIPAQKERNGGKLVEKPKDLVPEQERPTIVGTKTINLDETLILLDVKEESYFPDDDSY